MNIELKYRGLRKYKDLNERLLKKKKKEWTLPKPMGSIMQFDKRLVTNSRKLEDQNGAVLRQKSFAVGKWQ